MKFAFLLPMVVAMVGSSAHGQEKTDEMSQGMRIASVDVRKVFNEWKYSKESQKKIEDTKESLEKENNDRLAVINEYQMERSRMHQQYKANEGTMSAEDKAKMDAKFRSLGRDAVALEQDRRDFFEKGKRQLANEISSEAKLILDQITQSIQVYALEKKYHMVIETGGHTTRNVPLFVHLEGAVDITDEIITRLNEGEGN
ncbi:MAG: OmpH family outer membrane protein [Akkermansiaceae bacterium]|nr:OmpH family outer membrane protein [Akkermansiaceae bacterium]